MLWLTHVVKVRGSNPDWHSCNVVQSVSCNLRIFY